ncbi:hypothetical protein ACOSP7_025139 [Xanthoceras sorbifolium]
MNPEEISLICESLCLKDKEEPVNRLDGSLRDIAVKKLALSLVEPSWFWKSHEERGNGLVGSMMDIINEKTSNESANIMGSVATALKGPKLDVMKLNMEEVRTNVVAGAMSESASLRPPLREYVDRLKLEKLGEIEQL